MVFEREETSMRKPLRRLPSPATMLASIALLVALGGTSVAAVSALPSNSVGTAQLKANAVTSAKVKNASLLRVDFKKGQLPAGPTGARGPQGPAGPAGPAGVSALQRVDVVTPTSSVNSKTISAVCPAGKRVIGGGARVTGNGAFKVSINEAYPDSDATKFNGVAREVDATALTWALQVYAMCANVAS
jgi:hypothetical protein